MVPAPIPPDDPGDHGEFDLEIVEVDTDALEACCADGNALLTQIESNTDDLEALITAGNATLVEIDTNTDGIETALTAANASLDTIEALSKAEDAPHVSGETGVLALAVRNDANAALTDANFDRSGIAVDSAGRVKIVGDVTAAPAPSVERLVDGDFQNGAGSIVIPDGVISYGVTVLAGGTDPGSTASWVTINGPNFTSGAVPLISGQSVNEAADTGNKINGPITVTVPAGAAANATWITP